MISRLFGRGGQEVTPAPAAPTVPWAQRAAGRLSDLSALARGYGRDLDPAAYSQLRHLEDLLRPAIADAAAHPILPEREFAIDSMLTDLIPTTLAAYVRIPAADRGPDSEASRSLREQLAMLAGSASQIDALIKQDAVSALQVNALLLESRLR